MRPVRRMLKARRSGPINSLSSEVVVAVGYCTLSEKFWRGVCIVLLMFVAFVEPTTLQTMVAGGQPIEKLPPSSGALMIPVCC